MRSSPDVARKPVMRWALFKLYTVTFCLLLLGVLLASCRKLEELELPSPYRDDAQHLLAQGVTMLRGGDLVQAETSFLLVIELLPRDPRAYDGLGAVHLRRSNKEDALLMFQKAVALDPKYAPAYAHLALLAEDDGDIAAADELYRLSLIKGPLLLEARANYSSFLCRLAAEKRRGEDDCLLQKHMMQALLKAASRAVNTDIAIADEKLYGRQE